MDHRSLLTAVDAALSGDWHGAHHIVQQDEGDPIACWIHAVLHKMEGDAWNSRYWYRRTAHRYEEWGDDARGELMAVRAELTAADAD
jgi:hypothetical protein